MPTTAERLGIVETKVHGLDEKIDELKIDVKDVHDCLDKTRDDLTTQLKTMYDASCTQHSQLAKEISALKTQRDKWVWLAAGSLATIGWASGHMGFITKFFS
jgi:flagellar capping protein FliD